MELIDRHVGKFIYLAYLLTLQWVKFANWLQAGGMYDDLDPFRLARFAPKVQTEIRVRYPIAERLPIEEISTDSPYEYDKVRLITIAALLE